ncbi:MAG: hypothetical protein KAU58_06760, partial [Candidatus Omnitrophica bacterium]|nr:hypothetical protein [Candidatus Omnitrophota bacterium]
MPKGLLKNEDLQNILDAFIREIRPDPASIEREKIFARASMSGASAIMNFDLIVTLMKIRREGKSPEKAGKEALDRIFLNKDNISEKSIIMILADAEQEGFSDHIKSLIGKRKTRIIRVDRQYSPEHEARDVYGIDVIRDEEGKLTQFYNSVDSIISMNLFNKECYGLYEGVRPERDRLSKSRYYELWAEKMFNLLKTGASLYVIAGPTINKDFEEAFKRKFGSEALENISLDEPMGCYVITKIEQKENIPQTPKTEKEPHTLIKRDIKKLVKGVSAHGVFALVASFESLVVLKLIREQLGGLTLCPPVGIEGLFLLCVGGFSVFAAMLFLQQTIRVLFKFSKKKLAQQKSSYVRAFPDFIAAFLTGGIAIGIGYHMKELFRQDGCANEVIGILLSLPTVFLAIFAGLYLWGATKVFKSSNKLLSLILPVLLLLPSLGWAKNTPVTTIIEHGFPWDAVIVGSVIIIGVIAGAIFLYKYRQGQKTPPEREKKLLVLTSEDPVILKPTDKSKMYDIRSKDDAITGFILPDGNGGEKGIIFTKNGKEQRVSIKKLYKKCDIIYAKWDRVVQRYMRESFGLAEKAMIEAKYFILHDGILPTSSSVILGDNLDDWEQRIQLRRLVNRFVVNYVMGDKSLYNVDKINGDVSLTQMGQNKIDGLFTSVLKGNPQLAAIAKTSLYAFTADALQANLFYTEYIVERYGENGKIIRSEIIEGKVAEWGDGLRQAVEIIALPTDEDITPERQVLKSMTAHDFCSDRSIIIGTTAAKEKPEKPHSRTPDTEITRDVKLRQPRNVKEILKFAGAGLAAFMIGLIGWQLTGKWLPMNAVMYSAMGMIAFYVSGASFMLSMVCLSLAIKGVFNFSEEKIEEGTPSFLKEFSGFIKRFALTAISVFIALFGIWCSGQGEDYILYSMETVSVAAKIVSLEAVALLTLFTIAYLIKTFKTVKINYTGYLKNLFKKTIKSGFFNIWKTIAGNKILKRILPLAIMIGILLVASLAWAGDNMFANFGIGLSLWEIGAIIGVIAAITSIAIGWHRYIFKQRKSEAGENRGVAGLRAKIQEKAIRSDDSVSPTTIQDIPSGKILPDWKERLMIRRLMTEIVKRHILHSKDLYTVDGVTGEISLTEIGKNTTVGLLAHFAQGNPAYSRILKENLERFTTDILKVFLFYERYIIKEIREDGKLKTIKAHDGKISDQGLRQAIEIVTGVPDERITPETDTPISTDAQESSIIDLPKETMMTFRLRISHPDTETAHDAEKKLRKLVKRSCSVIPISII